MNLVFNLYRSKIKKNKATKNLTVFCKSPLFLDHIKPNKTIKNLNCKILIGKKVSFGPNSQYEESGPKEFILLSLLNLLIYFILIGGLTTSAFAQKTIQKVTIKNVATINSSYSEYSLVPFGNKLVFTSTRQIDGESMTKWRDEKKQFSDLYIVNQSDYGQFYNLKKLPGTVNSPVHDGIATFNAAGTKMYFTRNNKRGKNKQNFINLKIYSAEWIDGLWQNIEELPFNDEVYSNCHPSLSKDGNSLYFASNRPGGFGKMDLYVSKKVNGVWQPPVNLGSAVNSSSNEIFPFIRNTGDLYFSSDNPSGFGKMDIYIAKANLLSNDFEQCANLGWEFNSIADEFGFYASPDKEEGYFSSNRPGGKGSDDIYYWQKIKVAVAPPQVQFSFLDAQTNEQLSDAVVTVFDEGIHSTKGDIYPIAKMVSLGIQKDNPYHSLRKRNYRTGSKGLINVIISEHKSYTVFIEKEGYLPIKKVLLEQDLKLQKKWNFKLVRKAGIPLKIEAISMPYQQKVPHVSLELYNHNTQKVERVISDDTGRFTFYINCDTEYTLLGKKDNYRRYKKHFSTKYQDCDRMKTIKSKLYLVTEEIVEHISKSETIRFSSLAKYQAQKVNKVGQIIRLEDIKFKENKAKLTPHIKQSLSKVLHFLQKNPHIRVEISNHTDARGSAIFNHSLSQKRADAIGNYLIQRGIPKEQISTIGYGEDRLINHCQNDIECQEEAHRQNKRTELKITKIRKKATQNALIRYSNQRY